MNNSEKNINKQMYIYFYSPNGTWTRININLEHLGLEKNKKIANTYYRDFIANVDNNTYKEKYNDYDVIYLDEFYDWEAHGNDSINSSYNAMKELVKSGKQIVMAAHGDIKNSNFPDELKNNVTVYQLNYELDPPDLYGNKEYDIEYIK